MKENAELRAKREANLWQAREAGEGTSNPKAQRTLRKSQRVEEVVVQQLVLSLTRGGPLRRSHDNIDLDELSEAERWSDAAEGVGRTHSSRKTSRRRPAWRHAERGKRSESAVDTGSWKEGDCGGEGGNIQEDKRPSSRGKARHRKGPDRPTHTKTEEATYAPSDRFGRNAFDPTRQTLNIKL
jgi:hypothetical protein